MCFRLPPDGRCNAGCAMPSDLTKPSTFFWQGDVSSVCMADEKLTDRLQESTEGYVTFVDDRAEAVGRMLEFMYKGNYSPSSPEQSLSICTHIDVYELGDKYDIPSLIFLAKDRFDKSLNHRKVGAVLDELRTIFFKIERLPDAREKALQKILLDWVKSKFDELIHCAAFKEICLDYPRFAWDVLMATTVGGKDGHVPL